MQLARDGADRAFVTVAAAVVARDRAEGGRRMIRSSVRAVIVAGLIVGLAGLAGPAAATSPTNDEPAGAIPLRLGTPLECADIVIPLLGD